MAIKNINGLTDQEVLSYLENSNYITKYYNEALANLGQRNTREELVKFSTFTLREIFTELANYTEFTDYANILPSDNINANTVVNIRCKSISDGIKFVINEDNYNDNAPLFASSILNNKIDNASVIKKKKIAIIENLLKEIYNNEFSQIAKNINDNETIFDSYIYFDLRISFIQNGINDTLIYGSNDPIFVYYQLMTNSEEIPVYDENCINVVWQHNNYVKFSAYSFEIDDNDQISFTKYSLPYIATGTNSEHKVWWINDVDSGINAEAKNAINLNIVVALQTSDSQNVKILSGLNSYCNEQVSSSTHTAFIKWIDNNGYSCQFHLPYISPNDIAVDEATLLKNSLIMLISDVSQIGLNENVLLNTLSKGQIITLWRWDGKNDDHPYAPLMIDDTYALVFNNLSTLNDIIQYQLSLINQIEPDNFLFTYLIFDQILRGNKHDENSQHLYPVLQNISGSDYDNRYINNLNFSLRYVNSFTGTAGKEIKQVHNTSSLKFLQINSNESNGINTITNSIYKYVENNRTNYYNEYIPNYNVPVFDMSEFLQRDSNVINRQNILSFDNYGSTYYGYIGTSFDNFDKSTFHIGTGTHNINLGEYSLANSKGKTQLKPHDKLSLDFGVTDVVGRLNAKQELNVSGMSYFHDLKWDIRTLSDGNIYYSTSFNPQFKYFEVIPKNNNGNSTNTLLYSIIDLDNVEQDMRNLVNAIQTEKTNNSDGLNMYCNIIISTKFNNVTYYYKYNDLIIIDKLLKYLGISSSRNKEIYSNTNDIITVNGEPMFLVSNGNALSKFITIATSLEGNSSENTGIYIETKFKVFMGNKLDINIAGDLASSSDKLTITINECCADTLRSIWRLPTNITII